MHDQIKGALYVLGAVFLFSLMGAAVKWVSPEISSAGSVFHRGLIGALLILGYAAQKGIDLRGQRRGLLAARALVGTVSLMMVFYAFTRIPTAQAMLLNQTTPIFMVPLAVVFLGESTSWRHIVLVLLAFVGVGMVLRPDLGDFNLPGLLALLSAFFAALAYLMVRRLTATEHSLTIVFWFAVISAVAASPFAVSSLIPGSVRAGAGVILIGILGTVGQILLTHGYRLGEAGRLAVVGSMGAVFCVLWDRLFFSITPSGITVIGGLVVILSCAGIQMLRQGRIR